MNRKNFFKRAVLGAVAIWKSPEILAKVNPITYNVNPLDYRLHGRYNEIQLLMELQRDLNINLQSAILSRMDIHWTPEQEKMLIATAK